MKKLFKYKSALDIPELKNNSITEAVKKATSGSQYRVPPHIISQINDLGTSTVNCAVIITSLLRVFDEFGSHPIPVYRALSILLMLLKSGRSTFVPVARALVPEIQTILYLSFGEKRVLFRDQIHLMATSIYYFLMYDAALPDISEIERNMNTSVKLHLPPPPVDSKSQIQPKLFKSDSNAVIKPEEPEDDSEDDMDIPFEPKVFRPPPPKQRAPVPMPIEPEVVKLPEPEPEPEPKQPEPQEEEDAGVMLEPHESLVEVSKLQTIMRPQYDFSIESF
ncbi:hypothetical protein GPJ56_008746 [Histomonas meleagridis]|uniref:uncharacterized protein n=1 Tax=Histomonas meleagridis TaxID=135588 RepID=UPI00355956D9|nr:hypothetical protein GPJ56_008746 [Histomonas meleagridis]KAH0805461.1 hypothetical protein GO595_001843 [Histomonas meleagridis]